MTGYGSLPSHRGGSPPVIAPGDDQSSPCDSVGAVRLEDPAAGEIRLSFPLHPGFLAVQADLAAQHLADRRLIGRQRGQQNAHDSSGAVAVT